MPTEKRASARLFRLLFSKDETEGRSLTGKPSHGKPAKPKLEDQAKLGILYDMVREKFPFATREVINITLRDLLKPSHCAKICFEKNQFFFLFFYRFLAAGGYDGSSIVIRFPLNFHLHMDFHGICMLFFFMDFFKN